MERCTGLVSMKTKNAGTKEIFNLTKDMVKASIVRLSLQVPSSILASSSMIIEADSASLKTAHQLTLADSTTIKKQVSGF